METTLESWWVLSLAAKCGGAAADSPISLLSFAILLLLAWLATALLYAASPGGPAWGKYNWRINRPGRAQSYGVIPGPRGLPFVGSMGLMVGLAHHQLAAAAKLLRAERLMAFSLGETRVLVTSNPDVAKEMLNSSVFADRPVKESAYGLMFHRAIGFAPYGVYWRTLRKIAATHLFCPKQINCSEPQRFQIASEIIAALRSSSKGGEVRVREVLKRASLNNIMWSVFGRKHHIGEGMKEVSCMVEEGYELLGKLNWSDHLPLLANFDLQRIRFRCSKLVQRVNRFVNRIIQEHRESGSSNSGERTNDQADFVDVLLSLKGSDRLSDADMVSVLWEMIFRGTDTVAVLLEWVLARLVLHPDIQAKVHQELDTVVGKSRSVTESDTTTLVYLHAVVKEVLRLHPPGPLLSWARLAITDTIIDGWHVPAGTTAMVNMWAITHDPHVWGPDALEFRPERFLDHGVTASTSAAGGEFSVFGSDLRLAPFGSGRRTCPGKALALTTVSFWLASLLHEYEWLPPSDRTRVDLSEVLRLSCEMVLPLTANLRPRQREVGGGH